MSRKRQPRPGPGNYGVGYGRPPIETRFKPGQSGNPRGRPKGSGSAGALIEKLLAKPIAVTENGRTRRMPVLEAILRSVTSAALRRDPKAIHLLFALRDRYQENPDQAAGSMDLDPDDQAILDEYLARHRSRHTTGPGSPEGLQQSEEGIGGHAQGEGEGGEGSAP